MPRGAADSSEQSIEGTDSSASLPDVGDLDFLAADLSALRIAIPDSLDSTIVLKLQCQIVFDDLNEEAVANDLTDSLRSTRMSDTNERPVSPS